jgi:sulfotransferase family protein
VSRADSPLSGRVIFCFGARRSGTYLVQRMIAAHPAVSAVPSESHLISHGVAPLLERFHHGVKRSSQIGAIYADREALIDAVRDLCDTAFAEHLEPGASYVVERTPLHALHASLIAELYADAGVVHVIRDGRDVALSMVRRTWWGPDSISDAAREWADCVHNGRQASGLARYVEIRYEDLLGDPRSSIERVFEALGLESPDDVLEAALGELGIARNVEPGDRIGTGKWRDALSPKDLAAFDRVAGETLRELGYDAAPASPRETPLRSTMRALSSTGRRLGDLARRARPRRRPGSARRRAEDQVEEIASSAVILDRLLTAARERREQDVLRLLDPSLEAILLGPDGRLRTETGETARQLLADALVSDPALRGRQLAGEVLPGLPITAAAVELELSDGSRAGRFVAIDVRDRLVKRAIVEVAQPTGQASPRPRG